MHWLFVQVKLGSNVLPKNKKWIAKIHNEQNVPSGFMDINESIFRQDLYTWVWFKMCFVKKWTPTFDGYWSSVMCAKCYLTFGRHTQIRLWCQVTLPCHVEPLSLLVSVLSPLLFVVPPMLRLCSIMSWWKPWSPTYLLAETPLFAGYLYPIAILCMISPHSGCMYILYIYHQISIHHNQIVYTNNINCFCEIPIYLSA